MQSKAKTVDAYLDGLPPDRRAAMEAVAQVVRANVDRDVDEVMQYGMIGWVIPHRVYAPGYHCDPSQPVPFVGLASQKQHMSLYLMGVYGDGDGSLVRFLRESYAARGKRLDFGKSCLRFRRIEEIELDVVAELLRRLPAREYLARYVATVGERASAKRPRTVKAPAKKR